MSYTYEGTRSKLLMNVRHLYTVTDTEVIIIRTFIMPYKTPLSTSSYSHEDVMLDALRELNRPA